MKKTDLQKRIDSQRQYFLSGVTQSAYFRQSRLAALKKAILAHEDEICTALKSDLGKSEYDGWVSEVGPVLHEIDLAIKKLPRWMRAKRLKSSWINFPVSQRLHFEPFGVALVIAPWNYPFQLLFSPLVGAIAAGNCVALKPSEKAPASSQVAAKIISSVFAAEYISLWDGGKELATALLDFSWDVIFYTGSTAVGRKVMQAASRNLTPCTLELGGKSPCVVTPEIDLKVAARRIVWAKFYNAGQSCIAPDYLVVHEEVAGPLLEELKKSATEFFTEDPGSSTNYGKIINKAHLQRLRALCKQGQIVFGGDFDLSRLYLGPTMITGISWKDEIMQEEIFGPVLPVLTYRDMDELLYRLQREPKALVAYLYTKDRKAQKEFAQKISCGSLFINTSLEPYVDSNIPFGGVGASGMGKAHGKFSFDAFTHQKPVVQKPFWLDLPLKYPGKSLKLPLMKWLIKRFL